MISSLYQSYGNTVLNDQIYYLLKCRFYGQNKNVFYNTFEFGLDVHLQQPTFCKTPTLKLTGSPILY